MAAALGLHADRQEDVGAGLGRMPPGVEMDDLRSGRQGIEVAALAPHQDEVRTLPLTGDFVPGTMGANLNGIVAAKDGKVLLAVQSNTGKLFRINPRTGRTREVDLGGATLANGDGMLLAGRVLFVVQNRLNQIAVVKLSRSLDRGRVVTTITDPDFDVPTTIAFQAGRLWAVNARFGTTDPQPARYDIVRVG